MLETPPGLRLPERTGLPDAIAFLRRKHPKPGWRAHPNFQELSDFWLAVHDGLRAEGTQLKRATHAFREGAAGAQGFAGVFVPALNRFLFHLEGHYQIEDHAYFPRFRALDKRMIAGFDLLENDHEIIHEKLAAAAESGRTLAAALLGGDADRSRFAADAFAGDADLLLDWLLRHLADEEDLVIPAMLEHSEDAVAP